MAQGPARAAPRPRPRRDARELRDARRLRRLVVEEGERLHALLGRSRRHPRDDHHRLVRRLSPRGHGVLRGDGGEELLAAAADRRALEPRRDAGRRDVHARRRFRGRVTLGCAVLLRAAARVLRPLAAGRRGRSSGRRGAGENLRHGRRVRAQDRARQARPRRPLARRAGVAAARAVPTPYYLHGDGTLGTEPPGKTASRAGSRTTPTTPYRRSAATTVPSASFHPRARGWSRCGCGCSTRRSSCATS